MSFEIGLTIGMSKSAQYRPMQQQAPQQQAPQQQGLLRSASPYLVGAGGLAASAGSLYAGAAGNDLGNAAGSVDSLKRQLEGVFNTKGMSLKDVTAKVDDIGAKMLKHQGSLEGLRKGVTKGRIGIGVGLGLAGLGALGYAAS